ncbi:MAG: hypothetical protein AB7L84_15385 [Acidimicrobiia bacterium]
MVAFTTSLIIALLGDVVVVLYSRRRSPGASLSWGQAMAAATFAFFFMFWWYGVVPHQWLTWADNELGWRSDKLLAGPGEVFEALPFTLTWLLVRDLVACGIYGLALTLHVYHWAQWQDRRKAREVKVPASQYGRPLVRKG